MRLLRATRLAILVLAACGAVAAAAPAKRALRRAVGSRPAPRSLTPAATADTYLLGDTLAWVDGRAVTARDLYQRVALMPWPERRTPQTVDSLRVHALQSLVAEQLLARESQRLALGDTTRMAAMRAALVRALARDALYRRVTAGAPVASPAEIDAALRRRRALRGDSKQRAAQRRAVADSLRNLHRGRQAMDFNGALLSRQRVQVDPALFLAFADSLRAIETIVASMPGTHAGYPLPEDGPDLLRHRLGPRVTRAIATLADGPLPLDDVLEDMRLYPIQFHSLDRDTFRLELNTKLRTIVQGEIDSREALRRGLDHAPDVAHDVDAWVTAWRANELSGRVLADSARAHGAPARGSLQGLAAEKLADYVAGLAGRAHLRIDYAAARAVEIPPANVMTKRFIGFGGSMPAAPMLLPLWTWVPIWRAAHRPLP